MMERRRLAAVHPRRSPSSELERAVADAVAHEVRDRLRQRHRRAPARAARARRRPRRRGHHDAVHVLRDRGHDSQRRRHAGVRRHRARRRSTSCPTRSAAARTSTTKAVIPVDLFGQMAPIEDDRGGVPGLPIIEDAAQSIGARRIDRRRVAHGRRGRDDRHVQLLPVEEPRRLRRRRHDGHAGRGARRRGSSGCACTAARRSTSTTRSATTAGSTRCRRRCCSAKLPHLAGVEREAPRERRVLRRGVRRPRRTCATPYVDPANESIFNQYTIRVAAATSSRRSSRSAASARRSTIRCRSTCSRASRTSATRRAAARRASAPRTRCCRCRSIPELTRRAARRSRRRGARLLRTLSA